MEYYGRVSLSGVGRRKSAGMDNYSSPHKHWHAPFVVAVGLWHRGTEMGVNRDTGTFSPASHTPNSMDWRCTSQQTIFIFCPLPLPRGCVCEVRKWNRGIVEQCKSLGVRQFVFG